MDYNTAKQILKDKQRRGDITLKQYFNLVSKARVKFKVSSSPELKDIMEEPEKYFDGGLGLTDSKD